ncbi:PhzF family phenazine biosynthesis isomerase [Agromyces sp. CFH 90414]|uniref:PhzF family phenazine biosynthesis isomerase n=1 Tax=Agromyces agglutinans TaxID=2662258 RepID=A0A6I2F6W3_9MICO|nr:PhzF family phenazine biosynthesis protein [Agromyces agglutinans]MRG60071.1 PhzF family phenazine biosynthesis isomerase [Agromyces agglutinans]
MAEPEILHYAAFTRDPDGGNPAGVVLDASGLDDAAMQRIAAEVDYAETAFLTGGGAGGARGIRYFSPIAEVPFCGHATIATAVVLAEREGAGRFRFATGVGEVVIDTVAMTDASTSGILASFTSVEPRVEPIADDVLARLLDLLGLGAADLDHRYPPRIAYAGNRHPVLVVAEASVFDAFTFDPVAVRELMDAEGWAGTVSVLHPLGDGAGDGAARDGAGDGDGAARDGEWEARNLFPVGRIVEDPATGSAAASFGGYLRELALVQPPAHVRIRQGRHVGRPSVLDVRIPEVGGIVVSGTAVPIPA